MQREGGKSPQQTSTAITFEPLQILTRICLLLICEYFFYTLVSLQISSDPYIIYDVTENAKILATNNRAYNRVLLTINARCRTSLRSRPTVTR